ncbi:MAG: PA14 domain-containing protein, partial [Myxococcota bacterium]
MVHQNAVFGPLWAGGPIDQFAARYRGNFEAPASGLYTFYLNSDDGTALYVDGQQILLNDGIHPEVEIEGTVALAAGTHTLELQYFENGGHSVVELDWSGPPVAGRGPAVFGPTPQTGLRAEYFVLPQRATDLAQVDFSATPAHVATVSAIDVRAGFNTGFWVGGPADQFAALYRGAFEIAVPGTYTFYLSSDDGSALLIDGQPVVTNNFIHPFQEQSASVALTEGVHTLEVQYFEAGGSADLVLEWTGPQAPSREVMTFGTSGGVTARYILLSGTTSLMSQVDFSAPTAASERLTTIDRDVGTGAFWPEGPIDLFAAQYTGKVYVAQGGSYTFFLSS